MSAGPEATADVVAEVLALLEEQQPAGEPVALEALAAAVASERGVSGSDLMAALGLLERRAQVTSRRVGLKKLYKTVRW